MPTRSFTAAIARLHKSFLGESAERGFAIYRAARPFASPVNPCQLVGLRAVTIHAAPSIITDRSPGQPAKAARTAAEARARMSSG